MVNEAAGSNRISVFLFQTAWPGLAVGVCELDSLPHHLTLRGLLTNVGISQIIVFHCFGLYWQRPKTQNNHASHNDVLVNDGPHI